MKPADPNLVIQILLENINCRRAEAGLPPVVYDPELVPILQPLVDRATENKQAQEWIGPYSPDAFEVNAVLAPYGAQVLIEEVMVLSFMPSAAATGDFAYDWENYDGDPNPPCAVGYYSWYPDPFLEPVSRMTIVLGPPKWTGVWYATVMIIAGR